MRPSDLWPRRSHVIEVDATGGAVGQQLLAFSFRNYLAVTATESRRHRLLASCTRLRGLVTAAPPTNVVRQNNADVLILNGWAGLALGRFRNVRHARYIAIQLRPTPLAWLALLVALGQCFLFRLAPPRVVNCSKCGAGPYLAAFRVRRPRPFQGVRRFIPHHIGVAGFLKRLQTDDVRHAVLRWFEDLPNVAAGEDLDVLVDDASLNRVRAILDEGPGIQPVDVYSVTGLPGADFRSMPYFPPYLAEELLHHAVDHRELCRVPAPREHFLSLAYHAIYHKGSSSGIPAKSNSRKRQQHVDHDYATILRQHPAGMGHDAPVTLESLDAHLDSQGWRPPHDMLVRLARRNRWVRSLLRRRDRATHADDRLAVFLVREEALRRGGLERATQLIAKHGFRIVQTRSFPDHDVATFARSLRGGNWGRGPWPISGGPPVTAIVAYDPVPITPTRRQKRRFPFLANARLLCKEQLRDAFNEGFPRDQHCNVIHSSDNGREALDYLRIIMPDCVEQLVTNLEQKPAARAA